MKLWMSACLAVSLVGVASCSEDNDPLEQADEASDCNDICERYAECFDEDYNVDSCQDRCESRADDPDHRDDEERCSDCVEEASCGGAVFSCTDDCVGIVP